MMRRLVRRCDLCSSEILGGEGPDICAICELCAEDGLDGGYEAEGEYVGAALASLLPFTRTGRRIAPVRGRD